jgi:DNA-binding HxlR family transcriptional regulator
MDSNVVSAAPAVPLSELVRRGELLSADCPSREVLKHVTSRWGVLVLMVLLDNTCRFSDLRRKVDGVSEKMLAQTLQWLAADGFVVRTSYEVVPPHVDYRLTPLGEEVARQVTSLADWIEINLSRILSARAEGAGGALTAELG